MDFAAMSHSERGQDLLEQWDVQVAALRAAPGFAAAAPGALDWTNLSAVLMKLVPILVGLLTTGFTPAALITVIPAIITAIVPNLDPNLSTLLTTILNFFVNGNK